MTGVSLLMAAGVALGAIGCTVPGEADELDRLGTVKVSIGGAAFRLWVADEEEERARGLMFVTPDRLRPLVDGSGRGMVFVYPSDEPRNFWMKDTYVALDLAYLDSDGIVIDIHTMQPLDDRQGKYPSSRPAGYAIELVAGSFSTLGIRPGQRIDLWQ